MKDDNADREYQAMPPECVDLRGDADRTLEKITIGKVEAPGPVTKARDLHHLVERESVKREQPSGDDRRHEQGQRDATEGPPRCCAEVRSRLFERPDRVERAAPG